MPWQMLAAAKGAHRFVPFRRPSSSTSPLSAKRADPRVKLVAVTHMSNVLGAIAPSPRSRAWLTR